MTSGETSARPGGLLRLMARLFALRRTAEPRDPDEQRIPYTGRTLAGVYVTPDRALQNPVVWACVRYLSQTVAGLPWHVMRETSAGTWERMPGSRIDWLLYGEPNPEWTPFAWRETMMRWALLWGNAYAEIERDTVGRPIALWPIHPERVAAQRDETGALVYEVDNGSAGKAPVPRADMFHVRGMGDGPVGLSVIDYAAQSIGWAQATEAFGAGYFGKGANPSGVVTMKKQMDTAGFKRLRSEFRQLYTGARAERTMILDNDMDWKPISIEPDKSQFVETMQHQVDVICRWFGVPPHKVAHLLRATFSNIEHQSIEVVVDSIMPWVKRLEEEADAKLFGARRGFMRTKMNLNALMRGDAKARGEYYQYMRNMGVFSANDILGLEDMNPIGEEGNVRVMQSQYMPLEVIAAQKAPAASEPATPAPPDETEAMAAIEAMARIMEPAYAL